jgi:cytochrome oxidase assembly protein ShyY1
VTPQWSAVARYRFALRPRWILSHLLVLVLVVVMIGLGFWQLRRLDERKTHNASVRANTSLLVAPIDSLLHPNDPSSRGKDLAFRRVTVTGTYDTANEVIIRARSLNQRPGVWVATPLRLANGDAVVVLRGFLPTQGTPDAVPADAEPPAGQVTVEGLVQETQTRGTFGPTDPAGRLTNMARVDVARLQQQVPYALYPAYVQLKSSQPAQAGTEPEVLPEPVLDEGPHLGYAVQWFLFSTIAIVGYPLILRRSARNRDDEEGPGLDEASELVHASVP